MKPLQPMREDQQNTRWTKRKTCRISTPEEGVRAVIDAKTRYVRGSGSEDLRCHVRASRMDACFLWKPYALFRHKTSRQDIWVGLRLWKPEQFLFFLGRCYGTMWSGFSGWFFWLLWKKRVEVGSKMVTRGRLSLLGWDEIQDSVGCRCMRLLCLLFWSAKRSIEEDPDPGGAMACAVRMMPSAA